MRKQGHECNTLNWIPLKPFYFRNAVFCLCTKDTVPVKSFFMHTITSQQQHNYESDLFSSTNAAENETLSTSLKLYDSNRKLHWWKIEPDCKGQRHGDNSRTQIIVSISAACRSLARSCQKPHEKEIQVVEWRRLDGMQGDNISLIDMSKHKNHISSDMQQDRLNKQNKR